VWWCNLEPRWIGESGLSAGQVYSTMKEVTIDLCGWIVVGVP